MGSVHHVLEVHTTPFTEIWLVNISIKKWSVLLAHFAQAISDIHTVIKSTKTYIFTARCERFTTGQETDEEIVDGLFHAEEVGNKYSEAFLL